MERTSSHFREVIMGSNIWRKRAEVKAKEVFVSLDSYLARTAKYLEQIDSIEELHEGLQDVNKGLKKVIEETVEIIKKAKKHLEEVLVKKDWKAVLAESP